MAVRCLRQGPDALWICPVSLRGALSSQGYIAYIDCIVTAEKADESRIFSRCRPEI